MHRVSRTELARVRPLLSARQLEVDHASDRKPAVAPLSRPRHQGQMAARGQARFAHTWDSLLESLQCHLCQRHSHLSARGHPRAAWRIAPISVCSFGDYVFPRIFAWRNIVDDDARLADGDNGFDQTIIPHDLQVAIMLSGFASAAFIVAYDLACSY